MKAWQIQKLGDPWQELEVVDIETPTPGAGMLRVRVHATDLNFADILQCQGRYQVQLELPFVPGMNCAGTIVEVSQGSPYQVGQRIVGPTVGNDGGYAEEALVSGEQATLLPEGVDFVTASAMHITYGTAWFGLHLRGKLQPGETVLVLAAAGGVGSAAVDLAKHHGCWVVAAAGGDEKTAACRALGADEVIDYNAEDLYERVMSLTDGRGVDVVYDPVGGDYFDVARRLVAWEGRFLVIGFASGTIPTAPANHALVKNYAIVGVHMGGYRQKDPTPFRRCYEELHNLLLDRKISPLVDAVIGFDLLPDALLRLANRETIGRVVFDPTQ
ncbi:MAG: NADPH:quinone oxidoreductase family protein [Gammaproteobacteria bacterium]|nr:NADPH:quinone oxidoreductase family protein [Gammaproteobacteria bacterium]